MDNLLGDVIDLNDVIFAHLKGERRKVCIEKCQPALGLVIADNGEGFVFVKKLLKRSFMNGLVIVGDHIESINGLSMVGCSHSEVSQTFKDLPIDEAFTVTLVQPRRPDSKGAVVCKEFSTPKPILDRTLNQTDVDDKHCLAVHIKNEHISKTTETSTPTQNAECVNAGDLKAISKRRAEIRLVKLRIEGSRRSVPTRDMCYECRYCMKLFPLKRDFKNHVKTHVGIKTRSFKNMKIHTKEKPNYKCTNGMISLSPPVDGRIHAGETSSYRCKTCPKSFIRFSYLKAHLKKHALEQPYQCKYCKKSFSRTTHLKKHVRSHANEKILQCMNCEKSFMQTENLKSHEMDHTGERPYQCKNCRKTFTRTSHERMHTGDKKPYQCKYCKKSFNDAVLLKEHKRIHTGEKCYVCNTCGISFSRSSYLKAHLRMHTVDKGPYQCKYCRKSFTDVSYLKKHIKLHAGKKQKQ